MLLLMSSYMLVFVCIHFGIIVDVAVLVGVGVGFGFDGKLHCHWMLMLFIPKLM